MSAHFDPAPHYAPKAAPAKLKLAAKAMTLIGVITLLTGMFVLDGMGTRTRLAFLTNLIYFLGLSLGGLAFCAALTLSLARWGRPVKRIAEAFLLYAPVVWLLLLFFLLTGGLELYDWYNHPETLHNHKAIWLTPTFFSVRLLVSIGILTFLGLLYVRNSLRPDLGVAAEKLDGQHPAWWGRIIAGWKGADTELAECQRRQVVLSPLIAALYAIVASMAIFDLSMSLAPHWYSNMMGGWYFCSSFWLAMIVIGLYSLTSRGWMGIRGVLTPTLYHDLGKLIFAFCFLWAYMFYAQLLAIWYGNLTEEIGFLIVRLQMQPWQNLAKVTGALCFAIPFVTLLSRGLKKMPLGFGAVLALAAIGIWLERFLVAVPSVWMGDTIPLGLLEAGVTLGFIGSFLWVVTAFLSSVPPVCVTDPFMQPHPDDVHVVSADAHAH